MVTALEAPSKFWWSKAKTPSSSPDKKSKPSKALGSLFGLKSKKQIPVLSIQDSHLPLQSIPLEPQYPQSFTSRPPSKSVSSTRSRVDSLEPRTPSDFHHPHHSKARQSLLTLSDTDPFASARSVGIISSPSSSSDPTRLSAYSNTSSNDHIHRKDSVPIQRSSYASSSSQSQMHPHGLEQLPPSSTTPTGANAFHGKLLTKRSDSALNLKVGQPSLLHHSGTSAAQVSKMSSRPPLRPRGFTDHSSSQKSGFFVDQRQYPVDVNPTVQPEGLRQSSSRRPSTASSRPPATSPRVIVRQASLQHITSPTPPPTHQLPPPPQLPDDGEGLPSLPRRLHSNSTASATLYSTSTTLSKDNIPNPTLISPPLRTRQISERSSSTSVSDKKHPQEKNKPSHGPLGPPMSLKKALSHQSLLKRGPLSSTASPDRPTTSLTHDTEKVSQNKARGFPHPRISIPPLPLKHSNSSASTLQDGVPPEQKQGSTSSGRKRLFSGSSLRRTSTSQSITVKDEDSQSVLSVKSDQDLYINTSYFKPWISTLPSHPSFWDEAEAVPNTPVRGTADFAASTISPTLGRLELTKDAPPIAFTSPTLTNGSRQRGFSIRSSSTVASTEWDSESVFSGLSPRSQTSDHHYRFHRTNTVTASPRGTSNNANKSEHYNPLSRGRPRTATTSSTGSGRMSDRPATATGHQTPNSEKKYTDVAFEQSFFKSSAPLPALITSLPPPPRPRGRAAVITTPEAPAPKPSDIALSSPPPTRRPHGTMSSEKVLHRRSLMKKPSFLEIDDDDHNNEDHTLDGKDDVVRLFDVPRGKIPAEHVRGRRVDIIPQSISGSFLDLARESFDTVRSD